MSIEGRMIPPDVAEAIHSMRANGDRKWVTMAVALRRRGYSLAAIGNAAGVSRQRIDQLVKGEERKIHRRPGGLDTEGLTLPPFVRPHQSALKRPELKLDDEVMLRGLWMTSQRRHRNHGPGHPAVQAYNDLIVMCQRMLDEGWTIEQLAAGIDVPSRTFRGRLLRAGVRSRAHKNKSA